MAKYRIVQVINDINGFENELNRIEQELQAFATQTHIVFADGKMVYTAVLFYK